MAKNCVVLVADVAVALSVVAYKYLTLLVGLAMANMGFRLFLADKNKSSGDLESNIGKYSLSLRGGAPGIFFSLFGAIIVIASIVKGIGLDYNKPVIGAPCSPSKSSISADGF